jgi:hypothetical protein
MRTVYFHRPFVTRAVRAANKTGAYQSCTAQKAQKPEEFFTVKSNKSKKFLREPFFLLSFFDFFDKE